MASFVPDDFVVPIDFEGPGFRLEPLGPEHNERDHDAWMSSIEHIRTTPGFPDPNDDWPAPMSLEDNLADMVMHQRHFETRRGFTYSIVDGDEVVGCVYLYPSREDLVDAEISSWVTVARADLDEIVWRTLNEWLEADWPFGTVRDHPRVST
ncbi:MAG: N-acetyltransferase [Acidimicrobiia bacterium]|nr:N-acetyltransferase [Acidimicrobiia bacterium]